MWRTLPLAASLCLLVTVAPGCQQTASESLRTPTVGVPTAAPTPNPDITMTAAEAAARVQPLVVAAQRAREEGGRIDWGAIYDLYAKHVPGCSQSHFVEAIKLLDASDPNLALSFMEAASTMPDSVNMELLAAKEDVIQWGDLISSARAVLTDAGWRFEGEPCADWNIP